jgi:uncharacterized Zn finger protein (UPF0148 family)
MRSGNGRSGGAILKLYCPQCREYVFTLRNTSAIVRCPACGRKISGRKQREVWKELNDERQGRLDAVEEAMETKRPLRNQGTFLDD